MLRKYRVSFFKRLADSTGHPVDACQAILEIPALDGQRAIEEARRRFAEQQRIALWSLRADYATAELANMQVPAALSRRLFDPAALRR